VFGRDAILNTKFEANWNLIHTQKQNQKENSKRIADEYKAHDNMLCVGKPTLSKFGKSPWEGPYEIVKVNNNGTVHLKKGIIIETINVRQIKPYHNSS
jgi:hypothetical protein